LDEEEDGFRLIGSYGLGFARLLDGPILATYEEDTEYSVGGYLSPYEDIGLRLVQLVEARETARSGSPERREASAELKRFLQSIALQTRGRPTDLHQIAVRRLTDEGEQLVALVASVLAESPELSERTVEVLASFEVPREEMLGWALRLALPMFSGPELLSLRRGIDKDARRGEGLNGFPREFAVHLLAHRLRRPVGPIARKTTNGWAAEMMSASGSHCEICGVDHER